MKLARLKYLRRFPPVELCTRGAKDEMSPVPSIRI